MQLRFKDSAAQLNAMGEKVRKQLAARLKKAEAEGRKVLNGLGADLSAEDHSLSAVVARIRANNPDLRRLAYNLDAATYDLRGRLNWDLTMMSAYARLKAEEAYQREVKPRVEQAVAEAETRIRALIEKRRKDSEAA